MIQIKPILLGLPPQEANTLTILVLGFDTKATTATLYYDVDGLANGNITLTEEQFSAWGESMEYIENIVLTQLKLERI